jgi:hypothetical protein
MDLKFMLECSLGQQNGVMQYINYVSERAKITCLFKCAEYGYPHIIDLYSIGHATKEAIEETVYISIMNGKSLTASHLLELTQLRPDLRMKDLLSRLNAKGQRRQSLEVATESD